mmetsp:Transcript_34962/g.63689  ORF Transcript_34962/g.63689 Transcript_34962/m.63689 type:complete len:229 (-) Transcript_34962:890-1576(-)
MSFWQAAVAPLRRCLATMFTASWLSTNSHTPSVARIMNWSSGWMSRWRTSGSGITPMSLTARSPSERAMASPICVISASSHTRALSPGSGGGDTKPPAARMRAFSAGVSGLWSEVRFSATRPVPPPGARLAITARESPAQADHSLPSCMYTETAVVPEYSDSMGWSASAAFTPTKVSFSALAGSSASFGCFSSRFCTASTTNCDTLSPCSPWPSNTAKKPVRSLSAYG